MENAAGTRAAAACAECGQTVPATDMIHVGEVSVCAACKPIFLQKLAEGVKIPSGHEPIYFPVSTTKLTLLSFATFDLYLLYWFYKNWSLERARTGETISPFWRTVFSPVFAYSLFQRMYEFGGNFTGNPLSLTAVRTNQKIIAFEYSPGFLAGLYIALTLAARLPGALWLVSMISFVPMVLVQRSVNRINASYVPGADTNSRLSLANILVLVFGGTLVLLSVWGTFLE